MNLYRSSIKLLHVILVAGAMQTAALADDIEVYVGQAGGVDAGNAVGQPNVLFLIDTSGSMDGAVVTAVDYDPTVTYAGCFDPTRIYFGKSGSPTDCASTAYFPASALVCKDAASLQNSGFYLGSFLTRSEFFGWSNSMTPGLIGDAQLVECEADRGVHGAVDGDGLVYPKPGDPPSAAYTAAQGDALNLAYDQTTLYTANFLNYATGVGTTVTKTRLKVVQDVLSAMIDSMSGMNVGLMRFSTNNEGGPVTYPVLDLSGNRTALKTAINSYDHAGFTPLSETFYEAARYFRGDTLDFGSAATPAVHSGALASGVANTYKSPVVAECQSNYIVLLTDGQPTRDSSANARVPAMPGFAAATGKAACADDTVPPLGDGNGPCLDEIAEYLFKSDISSDFEGQQNVVTYTIGFELDHPLLNQTAAAGGGRHFRADNSADLMSAFTNIFNDIQTGASTFTSPAVSVNAFSRTTHRSELYFTVFNPAASRRWDGNVKKYQLGQDLSGNPVILDARGNPAVEADTGFFSPNSLSYWTTTPLPDASGSDGNRVKLGGVASHLPPLARRIFTYTSADAPNNSNLNTTANLLHEDNTAITSAMLGMGVNATLPNRSELLQWARGLDVKGEFATTTRPQMGDPLHSRPVVVQYGGTENAPDLTLFVTTNDGYLHAFNAANGSEVFSFVPKEQLPQLLSIYNNPLQVNRGYGLDASVIAWVTDADGDGVIETPADSVRLYFGQRRGGRNYYAMDVTDRSAPKLMWQISGGQGDFTELGQTWSDPVVTRMQVNGSPRDVLVFGGGYDVDQDNAVTRTADDVGRAVYVVDAMTGQRLWWASSLDAANVTLADMDYSIPSKVSVIDIDGDGLADIMYVGDMGGQVWRFDVDNGAATGLSIAGGRIADLATSASAANTRRFYHPPDVSYQLDSGIPSYLAIAMGSGYQAHPLDKTIQDRIYVLRDTDVFDPPLSYTTITEATLYNATANILGEGTAAARAAARVEFRSRSGWFIELSEPDGSFIGEKVLSEPQIVAGTLTVTTFAPTEGVNRCSADTGRGAVYFLNISDATPTEDFDQLDGKTRADRRVLLKRGGIPPSPTLVITEDGAVNLVGPEIVGSGLPNKNFKTYWQKR